MNKEAVGGSKEHDSTPVLDLFKLYHKHAG